MKAFCINLPRRSDRWREFITEPLPFPVIHIPGVEHENGSIGCIRAHQRAMRQFGTGLNLLMEDDFHMVEDWSVVEKAISQLPKDWHCLYLGAMLHHPLERHSENLFKLQKGWASHGIIYNGRIVSDFICKHEAVDMHNSHRNIDTWAVANVQPRFNCFIVYPIVAVQRQSFSDITKRDRNYTMIEHYQKYTNEMDTGRN